MGEILSTCKLLPISVFKESFKKALRFSVFRQYVDTLGISRTVFKTAVLQRQPFSSRYVAWLSPSQPVPGWHSGCNHGVCSSMLSSFSPPLSYFRCKKVILLPVIGKHCSFIWTLLSHLPCSLRTGLHHPLLVLTYHVPDFSSFTLIWMILKKAIHYDVHVDLLWFLLGGVLLG